MLTNWYTLRALARAWSPLLTGQVLMDAYSQNKGTLVLVFDADAIGDGTDVTGDGEDVSGDGVGAQSLTISLQSPHRHLFLDAGSSRARRNVADVFESALGHRVSSVDVANRDRLVYVEFDDASRIVIVPFGPRANVYWCPAAGPVETFLEGRSAPRAPVQADGGSGPGRGPASVDDPESAGEHESAGGPGSAGGPSPPAPRSAPRFEIPDEDVPLSMKALSARLPLFPKPLVREVMARCRESGTAPDALSAPDTVSAPDTDSGSDASAAWRRAAEIVRSLEEELMAAEGAWVYHDGDWPEVLSLARLPHLASPGQNAASPGLSEERLREERLDDISGAVRRVARRRLGLARFRNRYQPLERALEASARHAERSLKRMEEELQKPSRADEWEKLGHILMAQIHLVPPGAEEVELTDIMTGEGTVTISLRPELDAVRNAEWYYDRARRTRESRLNAESRLDEARSTHEAEEALLAALREVGSIKELDAFEKAHTGRLSRLRGQGRADDARPYRRYALSQGYEVWVGRNARENDLLTQRDSRPWDLWLHARGVPGSHVVLRLKGRSDTPPAPVVEAAARIAAWWSKARTSGLAPVIVTERKYVRKPRGGAVGAVLVEREDVVMVEPGLP